MKKILANRSIWIGLFAVFSLIVTFQAFNPTSSPDPFQTIVYKDYNNYIIFKQSFEHLKNNQDIYAAYPNEYWDLYKYTPTFSVFFGFFSLFPDTVGLGLWNALNALILVFAIFAIPGLKKEHKGLILLIMVVEMVTSIQNEQSNGIMTGLIVLGYVFLERKNYALATLFIVSTIYIKLFGILALILFLFYPNKWKLAAYSALWATLLFIIPLGVVDFEQYSFLWKQFGNMLINDHTASYGYSLMGVLSSWTGLEINKNLIVLLGAVVFLIPFIRIRAYNQDRFRMLALASVLLWVVVFNHKAESPTFVIAMAGIGLWFVLSKRKTLQIVVVVLAFIFTSLSATDAFPPAVREEFIKPYAIKAVPSILIWFMVVYEMITYKNEERLESGELSGV